MVPTPVMSMTGPACGPAPRGTLACSDAHRMMFSSETTLSPIERMAPPEVERNPPKVEAIRALARRSSSSQRVMALSRALTSAQIRRVVSMSSSERMPAESDEKSLRSSFA